MDIQFPEPVDFAEVVDEILRSKKVGLSKLARMCEVSESTIYAFRYNPNRQPSHALGERFLLIYEELHAAEDGLRSDSQ